MRTVAIIQARMGSARLPGKVLADVGGQPLLWHVVQRVRQARHVADVIVATPNTPADCAIHALCRTRGITWLYANCEESDVLTRFAHVIEAYPSTAIIVRLTADCPLVSPLVIDQAVEAIKSGCWDYVTNAHPWSGFVDGEDVEVFTPAVLQWLDASAEGVDREHVTTAMRRDPGALRCGLLLRSGGFVPLPAGEHTSGWSTEHLSVNTPDDLARVKARLTR